MENKTSNFEKDLKADAKVRAFKMLLYPKLGLHIDEEITDKVRQKTGLDIIASKNGEQYLIDEKCSATKKYLENGLCTFLQELQYRYNKNGADRIIPGWAIDTRHENTHYMLIIPTGKMKPGTKEIEYISKMKAYFISRKQIDNYFRKYGFKMTELLKIFNELPDEKKYDDDYGKKFIYVTRKDSMARYDITDGKQKMNNKFSRLNKDNCIKIVQSFDLSEQPINIPIPLSHLDKIVNPIELEFTKEESDALLERFDDENLVNETNSTTMKYSA